MGVGSKKNTQSWSPDLTKEVSAEFSFLIFITFVLI